MSEPKQLLAELYTRAAPDYGEVGAPLFAVAGRRLVEVAGVRPGERVLDVAAGRGAVLLPAAERVGPNGHAVGLDLALGMVEQAAATIAAAGLSNAEIRLGDAEQLPFRSSTFDRVLCSFAVFWFADLTRALAEMQRVLRPGGTLGFAFARGADPRWTWYEDLLRAWGALDDLPALPGQPGIREPGALVTRLSAAGFAGAREVVEDVELLYRDPEDWWASLWTHGSRVALERLPAAALGRVRTECLARAAAQTAADGLPQRYRLVYVLARRAPRPSETGPSDAPDEAEAGLKPGAQG